MEDNRHFLVQEMENKVGDLILALADEALSLSELKEDIMQLVENMLKEYSEMEEE